MYTQGGYVHPGRLCTPREATHLPTMVPSYPPWCIPHPSTLGIPPFLHVRGGYLVTAVSGTGRREEALGSTKAILPGWGGFPRIKWLKVLMLVWSDAQSCLLSPGQ